MTTTINHEHIPNETRSVSFTRDGTTYTFSPPTPQHPKAWNYIANNAHIHSIVPLGEEACRIKRINAWLNSGYQTNLVILASLMSTSTPQLKCKYVPPDQWESNVTGDAADAAADVQEIVKFVNDVVKAAAQPPASSGGKPHKPGAPVKIGDKEYPAVKQGRKTFIKIRGKGLMPLKEAREYLLKKKKPAAAKKPKVAKKK